VRLLAVVSLALAISAAWAWVQNFYRYKPVSAELSHASYDIPVLPGDQIQVAPVIGRHYFGDLQVPLNYANGLRHSVSPYLRPAPEQYPPFVQALYLPLTFVSLRLAATIYLALLAAVFLVPLWLLLAPLDYARRIVFLVPTAVLTIGFTSFMDRGNNVAIAVGLVAWALWAWREERSVWCGALLAVAIALKGYPAALLVIPLAYRRYRFAILVAASAVAANLVSLAFYPGGFTRNLREVLPALKGEASALNQLSSWSLYSVIPKTSGLILGPFHVTALLTPAGLVGWLPAIVYLAGLYFVIRRGRVPQWCWGPLTLASIQLIVPLSYVYTAAWASIAAVWYAWGDLVEVDPVASADDSEFTALRVLLLLALTATVTPSVFSLTVHGGFHTPLTMYLSPLLLVVTWCAAVAITLWPRRTGDETVSQEALVARSVPTPSRVADAS
jgi:hypothetical protein